MPDTMLCMPSGRLLRRPLAGFCAGVDTVALEAAEYGVTVNALCPGYVLTPLVEKQIPETAAARGISEASVVRDVILSAQPTRKFISDEEIGAVCAFLCSDAARSITGAAVPIDGGWTAQ
jgi:3-hydroxybutyrate dehydrogenase